MTIDAAALIMMLLPQPNRIYFIIIHYYANPGFHDVDFLSGVEPKELWAMQPAPAAAPAAAQAAPAPLEGVEADGNNTPADDGMIEAATIETDGELPALPLIQPYRHAWTQLEPPTQAALRVVIAAAWKQGSSSGPDYLTKVV